MGAMVGEFSFPATGARLASTAGLCSFSVEALVFGFLAVFALDLGNGFGKRLSTFANDPQQHVLRADPKSALHHAKWAVTGFRSESKADDFQEELDLSLTLGRGFLHWTISITVRCSSSV